MKPTLRDYQKTALDFCLKRMFVEDEKGAGLFLDPGLGKTLITLSLIKYLKAMGEIDTALVVAPLRVCQLVWGLENRKWDFNFKMNLLCKRVKAGLKQPMGDIDLINPESLHHVIEHADRYDLLVVDESTKFKTWTCKRMRAMRKMVKHFKKRLILTGTPASNSLADLHGQVFLLDDGVALGRNITVFRSLYMRQGGWQGRQWMLRDGTESKIHEQVAPLCLRLDAETCLDMPELVINDVMCQMPHECLGKYRKLKKELLAQLETGNILAQNAASAYMKMRQFANGQMYDEERNVHKIHHEKLAALEEVIEGLGGKPVLVFYQFGHDVGAIKRKYPKAPVLNGATKGKAAVKMLEKWNRGETHVQLVQNQAASHGLNMQGSGTDVVYYGLGDSLEVYEQSYRRVYRQGVKGKQVRVHRLLTKGTVDEVIRDRIGLKDQTQREFLEALKAHASQDNPGKFTESPGQAGDSMLNLNKQVDYGF